LWGAFALAADNLNVLQGKKEESKREKELSGPQKWALEGKVGGPAEVIDINWASKGPCLRRRSQRKGRGRAITFAFPLSGFLSGFVAPIGRAG